ncbi:hypothetical protein JB92DRAFT_2826563 [Gautieria morchelliformis]|nr:hypothetical protein JB92DRAFT_2826563 [Gautieria morchelliformis]
MSCCIGVKEAIVKNMSNSQKAVDPQSIESLVLTSSLPWLFLKSGNSNTLACHARRSTSNWLSFPSEASVACIDVLTFLMAYGARRLQWFAVELVVTMRCKLAASTVCLMDCDEVKGTWPDLDMLDMEVNGAGPCVDVLDVEGSAWGADGAWLDLDMLDVEVNGVQMGHGWIWMHWMWK